MEFLSFSPTLSVNDTKKHRLPVEKPSSSVAHKNNLYQRWTELRSAECCIVASLQQFVDVSLCCISLRHDDMKFIAASFFPLQPLMRSSKEKKAKEKRSHYSVIEWAKRIKRQLMEKWPARREFDRSSPRLGQTLSVDRPLFWTLVFKYMY